MLKANLKQRKDTQFFLQAFEEYITFIRTLKLFILIYTVNKSKLLLKILKIKTSNGINLNFLSRMNETYLGLG